MNDKFTLKQIAGVVSIAAPLGMGIDQILFGDNVLGMLLLGLAAITANLIDWAKK